MVFRRKNRQPIDPLAHVDAAAAPAHLRGVVADALASQTRFRAVVGEMAPGPLRDRVETLAGRVDAGVDAIWSIVQQVAAAQRMLAHLDPNRVANELKDARRRAASGDGGDDALIAALADRFASTQRLLNAVDDVDGRLRLLDTQLGAAVARAAELQLLAGAGQANQRVDELGAQLDGVLGELHALQSALTTVDAPG